MRANSHVTKTEEKAYEPGMNKELWWHNLWCKFARLENLTFEYGEFFLTQESVCGIGINGVKRDVFKRKS